MIIRRLGIVDYLPTWQAMQRFTDERDPNTEDEIWVLQHPPVFTLGMAADRSHVLGAGDIPLVQTDRGGQVTYHGPGQLVMYVLVDLRRCGLGVRDLVMLLERAVIEQVALHGVTAEGRRDAPGVYVEGRKLASLGLRVRRGASYRTLADLRGKRVGPLNQSYAHDLLKAQPLEVVAEGALHLSLRAHHSATNSRKSSRLSATNGSARSSRMMAMGIRPGGAALVAWRSAARTFGCLPRLASGQNTGQSTSGVSSPVRNWRPRRMLASGMTSRKRWTKARSHSAPFLRE